MQAISSSDLIARDLARLLTVEDLDGARLKCMGAGRIEAVDRDPLARAAMLGNDVGDFIGPVIGLFSNAASRTEEKESVCRAHLLDRLKARREMLAIMEVPEYRPPFDRHEAVSRRGVRGPHGHVPAAGRIADIHRIEQQGGGIIAPREFGLKPSQSIGAQAHHIDLALVVLEARTRQAGCEPRFPSVVHDAPPSPKHFPAKWLCDDEIVAQGLPEKMRQNQ
jgi:hypothetical protein